MAHPLVVNARHTRAGINVSRPTIWGNQFVIGRDGTREDVVRKHREWAYAPEQEALRQRAKRELRGKKLRCWCAPLLCHAETWAEIANS